MLVLYVAFARMRLPKAGDLPALALMDFPVFGAFTVFLGCGKLTVPASTATNLLIATIPAFTALWVVALLEERIAAVGWAGGRQLCGGRRDRPTNRGKEDRLPKYRGGVGEKGARRR